MDEQCRERREYEGGDEAGRRWAKDREPWRGWTHDDLAETASGPEEWRGKCAPSSTLTGTGRLAGEEVVRDGGDGSEQHVPDPFEVLLEEGEDLLLGHGGDLGVVFEA